jgi:hypothetical protein
MLFDFVHETKNNLNSFFAILRRLLELELSCRLTLLALAVSKSVAFSKANEERVPLDAIEFKTVGDVRTFVAQHRHGWKAHLKSVVASGEVQLVVQLVSPWVSGSNDDNESDMGQQMQALLASH